MILEAASASIISLVTIGFILSFGVSVGIGANDVGNSFGSVYGTKSLSLKKIIILSIIFETLGAILIGSKVTDTVRKGIIKLDDIHYAYYNSSTCRRPFINENFQRNNISNNVVLNCPELVHLLGNISILFACSLSLIIANYLKIPTSATHVVVGATLGYGLVALQGQRINWIKLLEIAGSWILSPVTSGIASAIMCYILDINLIKNYRKTRVSIIIIVLCFITMFVLLFSIFFRGSSFLKFDKIPDYGVVIITIGGSIIFAILSRILLIPYIKRKFEIKENEAKLSQNDSLDPTVQIVNLNEDELIQKPTKIEEGDIVSSKMITFLQIMTACNKSFAHGGNDVSNSVAPLISIWLIYSCGSLVSKSQPYVGLLAYGALGMVVGVSIWGKRVMQTIGEDITQITPISGYSIEFSSSTTVLIMTILGLPVSTTHCTVGSTVSIAWLRSGIKSVNFKLLISIAICCVVSIPFPAIISASIFCTSRAIMFGVS